MAKIQNTGNEYWQKGGATGTLIISGKNANSTASLEDNLMISYKTKSQAYLTIYQSLSPGRLPKLKSENISPYTHTKACKQMSTD